MNKFVYSALAATLVSTSGFASETEWNELDRELDAMSATLATENGGPTLGGWVMTNWLYSGDDAYSPMHNSDLSAFWFQSIRLNVDGATADYGYHVSLEGMEFGVFAVSIYEAYGTFNLGEYVMGTMGQFKIPFLRSGLLNQNRLMFTDRSRIATNSMMPFALPTTEPGLMFSGNFEMVDWALAGQNGSDTIGDEYRFTGRLNFDLMGDGAGHYLEGAYNASDGLNWSAAIAYTDDGFLNDGARIGVDTYLTTGPFSAWAEVVDNDVDVGDSTPWDIAASYAFTDQWEVGIRYEDWDDLASSSDITIGVNRYISGHDVKWQLDWRSTSSDLTAQEGDLITLGLVVSF